MKHSLTGLGLGLGVALAGLSLAGCTMDGYGAEPRYASDNDSGFATD